MKARNLLRSGWWIAVAASILTLAVAAAVLAPVFSRGGGGTHDEAFNLANLLVPRELVVEAMARDGVRVLSEPATIDAAEVDRRNHEQRGKLLVPDDRVIGVVVGQEARAYPLLLMRWHEVVNDVVGGVPIAVTYSPLCDSVVVFSRTIDGRVVDLGVSGLLFNSDTILYDRAAGPARSDLWAQLDGRVVAGAPGSDPSPLPSRVAQLATWSAWRAAHPDTEVLAPLPDMQRIYRRDPYHSYFGSDLLRFPVAPLPPADDLHLKDLVVAVTVNGVDTAFALPQLAELAGQSPGTVEVEVAGVILHIDFSLDPKVAVVTTQTDQEALTSVRYALWFAWFAFGGTIPDMISIPS